MRTPADHSTVSSLVRLVRWRRRFVAAVLVIAALTALAVGASFALAASPPPWWRPINPADPAILARARAVENGLVTVITEQRGPDPWVARIAEADASAWLASRLSEWTVTRGSLSRWPAEVRQVQAHFESGALVLGAHLRTGADDGRVVSVRLVPRMETDGSLFAPATSVRFGRLRVPAGLMVAEGATGAPARWLHARRYLPTDFHGRPEMDSLGRVLMGEVALARTPALRLSDGRVVRVLAVRAAEGFLEITCRTEPATR
ncbi:MAG: hypothetical protein ACKVS8_10150 [Phycisphaerales bacterium]